MKKKKGSFETYLKQVYRLVNQNAHYISKNSPMEFEDAQQEMVISVWRSYESFDPSLGVSFITFAYTRMSNKRKTLLNCANSPKRRFQMETPMGDVVEAVEDEQRPLVETSVIAKLSLDAIERVLKERKHENAASMRAYRMFRQMRKGVSLREYSRKASITSGWASRLFTEKIKALAPMFEG